MQAEESLGTQCTCSCYIELSSRAPPSRLQSRGGGGGGHHPASQLFYSLLRHRQYCATTIAPTPLPHPSTCFFHLSTATVRAGGAAKLYVAAVAVAPRAMMNSTPLVFSVIPPLPPSRSPLLLTDSLPPLYARVSRVSPTIPTESMMNVTLRSLPSYLYSRKVYLVFIACFFTISGMLFK